MLTDPAITAYIDRLGGPAAFAARHNLSLRNAERIHAGTRPCPNKLRDEIEIREIVDGLTEAQRKFVTGASNFCPHADANDLIRKGVILEDFDEDLWTPLGQVVREKMGVRT